MSFLSNILAGVSAPQAQPPQGLAFTDEQMNRFRMDAAMLPEIPAGRYYLGTQDGPTALAANAVIPGDTSPLGGAKSDIGSLLLGGAVQSARPTKSPFTSLLEQPPPTMPGADIVAGWGDPGITKGIQDTAAASPKTDEKFRGGTLRPDFMTARWDVDGKLVDDTNWKQTPYDQSLDARGITGDAKYWMSWENERAEAKAKLANDMSTEGILRRAGEYAHSRIPLWQSADVQNRAQETAMRDFLSLHGQQAAARERASLADVENKGRLDVAGLQASRNSGDTFNAAKMKALDGLRSGQITPDQFGSYMGLLSGDALKSPEAMSKAVQEATAQAGADRSASQMAALLGADTGKGFALKEGLGTADMEGFLDRFGTLSPADQAVFTSKARGGQYGDIEKLIAATAPALATNYLRAQPPTYPSGPKQGQPINFAKELFDPNFSRDMIPSSYAIETKPGSGQNLFSLGSKPSSKPKQFLNHLLGRDIRAAGVPFDQITLPGGRQYDIAPSDFMSSMGRQPEKATSRAKAGDALIRALLNIQ